MEGVSLDLTLEGCHAFWKRFPDPNVSRVVRLMEEVETWALDRNPDVDKKLIEWARDFFGQGPRKIEQLESLVKLCAYVRMSRKLRLMQLIDQMDPGAASRMIQLAEQQQFSSPEANLFLRRNVIFERMRITARILSAERLAFVKKIVESSP